MPSLSTLYQIQNAVTSAIACWDQNGKVSSYSSKCIEANSTVGENEIIVENADEVASAASAMLGNYLLLAGLTSIITLAFLGRGVDVLGRRFPLYLSMVGTALSCFAFLAIYNVFFEKIVHFGYLAIPAVLQGLSGGGPGFALSMWTMTADISPRATRVANFAFMEASIFIGNLIGTLVAGQLLSFAGVNATLIFTISLTIVVSVFGYFFLRGLPRHPPDAEEHDVDGVKAGAEGGAAAAPTDTAAAAENGGTAASSATAAKLASTGAVSTMSILRDMTHASWWTRSKLNVVIFFAGFALAYTIFNLTPVFLYYLPAAFDPSFWTPSTVGLFLSSQWLCRSVYLVCTPLVLHRFCHGYGAKRDVWVVRVALLSYTLSCVLYSVVQNDIVYFFINLVDGFGCLAVVTCRGLILHSIENPDLFGRIGSLIAIVETVVTLLSPYIFTVVFSATFGVSYDGTAFLVGAGFVFLGLILTFFVDIHAVDAAHMHQQQEGFAEESASAPLLSDDAPDYSTGK